MVKKVIKENSKNKKKSMEKAKNDITRLKNLIIKFLGEKGNNDIFVGYLNRGNTSMFDLGICKTLRQIESLDRLANLLYCIDDIPIIISFGCIDERYNNIVP